MPWAHFSIKSLICMKLNVELSVWKWCWPSVLLSVPNSSLHYLFRDAQNLSSSGVSNPSPTRTWLQATNPSNIPLGSKIITIVHHCWYVQYFSLFVGMDFWYFSMKFFEVTLFLNQSSVYDLISRRAVAVMHSGQ